MKTRIAGITLAILFVLVISTGAVSALETKNIKKEFVDNSNTDVNAIANGDGAVYYATDLTIYKLDKDTGNQVWSKTVDAKNYAADSVDGMTYNESGGGVIVVYSAFDEDIETAYIDSSGTEQWVHISYNEGPAYRVLDYRNKSNTVAYSHINTQSDEQFTAIDETGSQTISHSVYQGYSQSFTVLNDNEVVYNHRSYDGSIKIYNDNTNSKSTVYQGTNSNSLFTSHMVAFNSSNMYTKVNDTHIHKFDSSQKLKGFNTIDMSNEGLWKYNGQIVIYNDDNIDQLVSYNDNGVKDWNTSTLGRSPRHIKINQDSSGKLDIAYEYYNGSDYIFRYDVVANPATSLNTTINGKTSNINTYGSDSVYLNSTATFSDGSTSDVNSSVTYSGYDTNVIKQNASTNEFYGVGVGGTTITTTYTDSSGNTVTDSTTVVVNKPVTNANFLLTGSDDGVFSGTEQETYATEITYYNGTTEYANDTDLAYSYDSNTVIQVSDPYTNLQTFEGESTGTTTISSTYTGFDGATTSTGSSTLTVNDPPKATSIDFVNATTLNSINGSITLEQGESYAIKQKVNYDDGSSTYSTAYLNSANTTEVSVTGGGVYTANIYGVDGHTQGFGSTYQNWFGSGVSNDFDINIVAEPESVNLKLANDKISQGQETSYTVFTKYENGTEIDDTQKAQISHNGTTDGVVKIDNQNATINVTGYGKTEVTAQINPSDSAVLTVEPNVEWDNYSALDNQERLLVSLTDLEFLTLFIGAIVGSAMAARVNMFAAVGTFGMVIFIGWAVGILPIYMPMLMVIFMGFIAFAYQFMDLSMSYKKQV